MEPISGLKILFILNPSSGGRKKANPETDIRNYFKQFSYHIEFLILTGENDATSIRNWLDKFSPQKVVSVGGDGTLSLVAGQLIYSSISLGIIASGSANGMATELGIPEGIYQALDLIVKGKDQKCDVLKINENQFCVHLSDLGLNARLIKYYDKSSVRGMWGYIRLLLRILLEGKPVKSHIKANEFDKNISAYMIVIANATKYGTGAVINPEGCVNDGKFELVVVRKISFIEFVKLFLRKIPFNPKKVEIFQTDKAEITTKRKAHFQIDGEYLGKQNKVTVEILPSALSIITPK